MTQMKRCHAMAIRGLGSVIEGFGCVCCTGVASTEHILLKLKEAPCVRYVIGE